MVENAIVYVTCLHGLRHTVSVPHEHCIGNGDIISSIFKDE